MYLKYNWLYIYEHLRKRTISCKQEYLVDTLGGIGHITCGYAGIHIYTNNIPVDTQVYTSYMPGETCHYVWICQLHGTCLREAWSSMPVIWHMFKGSMEQHASYMAHVSGKYGAACQLHDTYFSEAWSNTNMSVI